MPSGAGAGGSGKQAGHRHLEDRRHHRGPLQVHRKNRQGCLWHRAADGRHGGRRAADPEVPESERVRRFERTSLHRRLKQSDEVHLQ